MLTRQKYHLDREQWQHWAIFLARFHLYAAPERVRAQFVGIPSKTPPEVINLAEIFALLYVNAEDQAKATDTQYCTFDLWLAALRLQEGSHE